VLTPPPSSLQLRVRSPFLLPLLRSLPSSSHPTTRTTLVHPPTPSFYCPSHLLTLTASLRLVRLVFAAPRLLLRESPLSLSLSLSHSLPFPTLSAVDRRHGASLPTPLPLPQLSIASFPHPQLDALPLDTTPRCALRVARGRATAAIEPCRESCMLCYPRRRAGRERSVHPPFRVEGNENRSSSLPSLTRGGLGGSRGVWLLLRLTRAGVEAV
jgi:hypothetical protein